MYSVSQFKYETLAEAQLKKAAECRNGIDSAAVKAKDKAAGAFALWVEGVCKVREIGDEKVPKLKELQAEIEEQKPKFDAERESINAL